MSIESYDLCQGRPSLIGVKDNIQVFEGEKPRDLLDFTPEVKPDASKQNSTMKHMSTVSDGLDLSQTLSDRNSKMKFKKKS